MATKSSGNPTQKIVRAPRLRKPAAPKTARRRPLAEEVAAEIAAPPAGAPEPAVEVMSPVLVIEPRIPAGEDEPTTRVVFRQPAASAPVRRRSWIIVFGRSVIGRLRTELAPVGVRLERRFPRLADLRRIFARWV